MQIPKDGKRHHTIFDFKLPNTVEVETQHSRPAAQRFEFAAFFVVEKQWNAAHLTSLLVSGNAARIASSISSLGTDIALLPKNSRLQCHRLNGSHSYCAALRG